MIPEKRCAGDEVRYTITYLEMNQRPRFANPVVPGSATAVLLQARDAPVRYFLSLYDAVGAQYEWQDQHDADPEERAAFVGHEDVVIYTFLRDGWTHGFFMLDWREAGECDLAYFGLVPEAVGMGLGSYLLRTAILTAWGREGVERMTVNTCTLDHPRALAQYQRHGFEPYRQEVRTRTLVRDWDPATFP